LFLKSVNFFQFLEDFLKWMDLWDKVNKDKADKAKKDKANAVTCPKSTSKFWPQFQ